MNIFTADLSEILLAERRDEEQINHLTSELSQIIKDLFGSQIWVSFWTYYPVVAAALYYAVTSLSAVQTIGEEYVALLPLFDIKRRKVPSFIRRLVFVFGYALAPFLTEKSLQQVEKYLENLLANGNTRLDNRQRIYCKAVLSCISWIRFTGIPALYRLHLALFYLFGTYYSISKRLVGLQYVSFRAQANSQALSIFRFFGALTILKTLLSVVIWVKNELKRSKEKELVIRHQPPKVEPSEVEEDDLSSSDKFSCPICSQNKKSLACTPCGHIFCWSCISKHIQLTATESAAVFCPECRNEICRSRVTPLLNF